MLHGERRISTFFLSEESFFFPSFLCSEEKAALRLVFFRLLPEELGKEELGTSDGLSFFLLRSRDLLVELFCGTLSTHLFDGKKGGQPSLILWGKGGEAWGVLPDFLS